ncbi:MAG TPA: trypsin-like serine protease [Tepidisphaeraceae bacterium]|jgi:hypothetical protein|nr:trypsin-like serine protease [Tepidisphaeraceae bacterium]
MLHQMRLHLSIALIVSLFTLTSPIHASTIRHDRNQSDYLSVGDFFTSVGRVDGFGTDPKTGSSFNYIASGTLIAPDWVLTAAHVVDIAQTLSFTVNGTLYTADAWHANPNWTGDLTAGYDLGLFHLSSAPDGITPAKIYTGAAELNKIGTFVGYGKTGTGLTGATTFDGRKRGAQNMLDAYYNSTNRILLSDFDNPNPYAFFDNLVGSRTPLYIEGLIAPGDSGGPVFITDGATRYIAGVNSFVGGNFFDGKADSDYGDISGATRVSIFANWINDTISTPPLPPTSSAFPLSSGAATLTPALATVPEPASLSTFLLAIPLFFRRRHRID